MEYSYDSDSEDDMPQANRFKTNNIIWQKHVMPSQVRDFSEEFGANISDTCESPIDVFHCMFTYDILII
jgi:hypothetical protein